MGRSSAKRDRAISLISERQERGEQSRREYRTAETSDEAGSNEWSREGETMKE